jgi:hypothetical protein
MEPIKDHTKIYKTAQGTGTDVLQLLQFASLIFFGELGVLPKQRKFLLHIYIYIQTFTSIKRRKSAKNRSCERAYS